MILTVHVRGAASYDIGNEIWQESLVDAIRAEVDAIRPEGVQAGPDAEAGKAGPDAEADKASPCAADLAAVAGATDLIASSGQAGSAPVAAGTGSACNCAQGA